MAKAQPAPAPVAAKPAYQLDQNALMFGGVALALILFAAAAFALARRRRRRREEAMEEQWQAEQAREAEAGEPARDPLFDEQPAVVAPAASAAPARSAFAWDNQEQPCDNPIDDGSDRCPGETWVERAYRGPSPANPSVSLKHRLSRAAFFDKREREVAAGTAAPVDPDAGLPEAMVEEQENENA
jgi:hypothetical protein